MTAATPDTERFVASLHRAVLGVLLAVVALTGLGWFVRAAASGERTLLGVGGLAIAAIAGVWIAALFAEGLRER